MNGKSGRLLLQFTTLASKTSALNYCPICLTTTCCKTFEHIISANLVTFLEPNLFFSSPQRDFRKYYSCDTRLISFTDALNQILDQSSIADCIFLDFSKAFDKVCHKLILLKLNMLDVDSNLLKWIECFLLNWSQFVSTIGFYSELSNVHSDIPQGFIFGPLLFLIYITYLPSLVNSRILLFADDYIIFRKITNANDNSLVESDLNTTVKWCNEWLMQLNIKCKVMRDSRTTPPLPYIDNISSESAKSYK